MRHQILTFTLSAIVGGAAYADCPPAPDYSELQAQIYSELQQAPNEMTAHPLMGALWSIWKDAPDAHAQTLLDAGIQRIRVANYTGAIEVLDQLIAYCPDYAEGYNQRAFASYLQFDYDRALPDLDRAIELSPQHTAARSGRVLTLLGMGRAELAQSELRLALDLNPWLPERRYLAEPKGEEL